MSLSVLCGIMISHCKVTSVNYHVDCQLLVISDHFPVLHSRRDFCVNISEGSAKTINHLCITWPTHVAVEEGEIAVLCCWALHLTKTTVKNIFQRISAFMDGKTCAPEASQSVVLHHKQSLQSAVPLQLLFSKHTDFTDTERASVGEER